MSRAAWTSVFAVSGLSVVRLIAQAPRGSISTWPVASAPTPTAVTPVVWRKRRRVRRVRLSSCLMVSFPFAMLICPVLDLIGAPVRPKPVRYSSAIAPVALQHLDLVAVGIGDEEEAGEQAALAHELLDRRRRDAEAGHVAMLGGEILDDEGEMAIGLAVRVGLGAPVIDGELELDVLAGAPQVDEGEAVEGEALLAVEAEGVAVEALGALLVENPDHRVDQLGHRRTITALSTRRPRLRYSR